MSSTRTNNKCFVLQEGKSEYLEGLLEATKELSHIDRSNIFYHLLVTYCKANETDKALGLWTLLQEEGEVPSEQFLIYLGNHLKAKNREIPFVMPVQETQETKKQIKEITTTKPPIKPAKSDVSAHIEQLVKDGKTSLAMDHTIKSLDNGVTPKSSVMKFLLKNLAEDGNVEKISLLGNYINESMRKQITYNDKLTQATFVRGAGLQHVNDLLNALEAAETDEEFKLALTKFPRSATLASAIQNDETLSKCKYDITLVKTIYFKFFCHKNLSSCTKCIIF